MYGISAAFWLALLQLNSNKSYWNLTLSGILLLTIILSGSRGAFVAGFLVMLFSYLSHARKIIIGTVIFLGLLYTASFYLNFDYLLGRFTTIADSASSSGRLEIWDLAFQYIDTSLWGQGMDAPLELLNTGNVHNSYIRYLLTMGYVYGSLAIAIFVLLLFAVLMDRKIPRALVGFFIGYALACYGEDFFVGVGSSIFIYMMILIGLINYYATKPQEI
jgi:O-antigen ligase